MGVISESGLTMTTFPAQSSPERRGLLNKRLIKKESPW